MPRGSNERATNQREDVEEVILRNKPKLAIVKSKKQPMMCMYPGCKFHGEGEAFPLCKDKGTAMHRDWYYEWMKKLAGTTSMKVINEKFQGADRDNLAIRAFAAASTKGRFKAKGKKS